MHTAVVKFYALANAIRAAAQHHNLAPLGGIGFAFLLVAGIKVSAMRGKLGGTGVHALKNRAYAPLLALRTQRHLIALQQRRQPAVGKTAAFEFAQLFL